MNMGGKTYLYMHISSLLLYKQLSIMESSVTKTILLTNKDTQLPKINLKYNVEEINTNINQEEYNKLIFYKNKIDKVTNHKIWDKAKKFSNNYFLSILQ